MDKATRALIDEVEASKLWDNARLLEQLETEWISLKLHQQAANFLINSSIVGGLVWLGTGSIALGIAGAVTIWLIEVRLLAAKRFIVGLSISETKALCPNAFENAALREIK